MDMRRLQDEINVELIVPAATDEVLVAAAKSGNHHAFAELWTRHSNTAFKWLIESAYFSDICFWGEMRVCFTGFLAKTACRTWFFDGEIVVDWW